MTRPDTAPACDYRVWKGLEEYPGVRRTADLLADLPPPSSPPVRTLEPTAESYQLPGQAALDHSADHYDARYPPSFCATAGDDHQPTRSWEAILLHKPTGFCSDESSAHADVRALFEQVRHALICHKSDDMETG